MTTALLAVLLCLPAIALGDRDRGERYDDYGENCYEHKGKLKCKGGKGRGQGDYRAESGHAAGGPPPWAPAHGWRRKHQGGGHYAGHDDDYRIHEQDGIRAVVHGKSATVDVGVKSGTCNRKAVGTVLGGLIGGVIGNKTGSGENREVRTVLGAVIGGLIGNRVGRSMDQSDQHCAGQVLEQAPDRHTVRWADEAQQGEYRLTPERTYQADGRYCRDYISEYHGKEGIRRENASACRTEDGAWQKVVM